MVAIEGKCGNVFVNHVTTLSLFPQIIASMTHYFFLATFIWMSMEAVGLYRAVVLVFTSSSNMTFLVVASCSAWGE